VWWRRASSAELQPRQRVDAAGYLTKALDPGAALRHRIGLIFAIATRAIASKKTRIDAVIARLDALA